MENYCNENFVSKGMIADFCIHDKEDNPHCHILLTMRPFKENGTLVVGEANCSSMQPKWDSKSKKKYVLDDLGEKIKLPSGNWKSIKVDTTDWNSRENAELWRSNWSNICNKYLEQNNISERLDHRSYERQGINKIPSIHLGVSACQMEKKGIVTDRGNLNREIAEDNNNLKVARARITRLMKWRAEESRKPLDLENTDTKTSLISTLTTYKETTASSHYQNLKNLKNMTSVVAFLQENNIEDLDNFYNKIAELNKSFYDIKGEINKYEKEIVDIDKRLDLWEQYEKLKPIAEKYNSLKGKQKQKFYDKHYEKLADVDSLRTYWRNYKSSKGEITPKSWKKEQVECEKAIKLCKWKMDCLKLDIGKAEKVKARLEELAVGNYKSDINMNLER